MLQVVNLLSPQFGWTAYQQKSLTYLVAAAIAPVAILAWFHGKKGFQAFGGRELFVLGLLLLVLGFGLMHLNGRWSEEADLEFLVLRPVSEYSASTLQPGRFSKESDLIKGVPVTVTIEQSFSGGDRWLNYSPKASQTDNLSFNSFTGAISILGLFCSCPWTRKSQLGQPDNCPYMLC